MSKYHIFFILLCVFFKLNSQEFHVDDKNPLIEYLKDDLWNNRDAYDASHFLMIPLHYSFKKKEPLLIKSIDLFFERFALKCTEYTNIVESPLKRNQFNYFCSEYLKIKCKSSNFSIYNETLLKFLINEVRFFWREANSWNWKWPDNNNYSFKGSKNRIIWKLNTKEVDKSYYKRLIIDEEFFLIATASNLKYIINKCSFNIKKNNDDINLLDEISEISYKIFLDRTSFCQKGVILQKGMWYRHRDYKYASCMTLECCMSNKNIVNIEDIAQDTSHSLRLPLILTSLIESETNYKRKFFYKKIKRKLSNQLIDNVIVNQKNNKCYLVTNYMDGRNGFYRWNYETHKKKSGYGPFENYETFKLGWWSFLGKKKVNKIYYNISVNIDNDLECESIYKDKTTRERHPVIEKRYENELFKFITSMAGHL